MAGETKTTGVAGWILAIAIGRRPKRTLVRLGVLIAVGLVLMLVGSFILLPVQIDGPSMYPTYHNGQINFINRLAYLRHEPERGDVVGVGLRAGWHIMYVKRIVGLPGEKFAFRHGKIYINDLELDEPYLKLPSNLWDRQEETLGPREYYVVGDNRSMPFIDHEKGSVDRSKIIGKILLRGNS